MYENRNNLVTKSLLHQHKAVFLTHIVKNNDLKAPNPLYYLILFISFACQSYVLVCHSYVIRMSRICTRMSSVCHLYVLVYHPYVTRIYSYVIRMSPVCTRMSFVCHSYALVCHPYVTRMWFYHELWCSASVEIAIDGCYNSNLLQLIFILIRSPFGDSNPV